MRYLSSFRPLNINTYGRKAIKTFGLPPYVDGSCRREPDFESKFPSISALCRLSKFAPRLHEGDTIVYITVKGKYAPITNGHWRLIAILKVLKRFDTHQNAAEWYIAEGIPLPSNCIVDGNPPLSLEKTTGPIPSTRFGNITDPNRVIRMWDGNYRKRAKEHGTFLVCEPQFVELYQPPILTNEIMQEIFGKIPATRNPPGISEDQLMQLENLIKAQKAG